MAIYEPQIDHAAYMEKVKTMTETQLLYTIQDCRATLDIWPDAPKAGYYMDEIHYCSMELARRTQRTKRVLREMFGDAA